MTDPDIINMARAAGWDDYTLSAIVGTEQMDRLQAFARLVGEDCAKRCDDVAALHDEHREHARAHGADTASVAIRKAYKP